MKSVFKHVAVIGKTHTNMRGAQLAATRMVLEGLAHFLHDFGCEVLLEVSTAQQFGLAGHHELAIWEMGHQCDLALVVGGDGTMLGVGRQLAGFNIPLIGINQGRLGFITDIPLEAYPHVLPAMLGGNYTEERRSLIHARVMRDGECVFDTLALNDVVVNRGSTSGMVELQVEIDGNFLASQRADGLIVATPTGSTAYALSAGGPLMSPVVHGWVLVPIAPHTLSNRPIVLDDSCEIAIEVVSGRDASANFDHQSLAELLHGDRIIVKRSEHKARFLHPKGWNYFDTLRKKLHWNEGGSLT